MTETVSYLFSSQCGHQKQFGQMSPFLFDSKISPIPLGFWGCHYPPRFCNLSKRGQEGGEKRPHKSYPSVIFSPASAELPWGVGGQLLGRHCLLRPRAPHIVCHFATSAHSHGIAERAGQAAPSSCEPTEPQPAVSQETESLISQYLRFTP